MIKVIDHGYKKYYASCYNCMCYFEYEIDDVNSKGVVQCPDCKNDCYHTTLNVDLTSKIRATSKELKGEE